MEISQITVHRQCLLKTILKWDNIFSHFLQSLKRVEWVDVIRSFRESKKQKDNFEYKHGVCRWRGGGVTWLQGTKKIGLDILVSSSNNQATMIQVFSKLKNFKETNAIRYYFR